MILKDIIYKGIETVSALYPEREAREMVFAYMEDVFGLKRYAHILEPGKTLPKKSAQKTMDDFSRMAAGEPLQYITGKAHFYGRRFRVTPDVLIPRPETELLCRDVADTLGRQGLNESEAGKSPVILDLCTGSGCIAWTLALEIPGAEVAAIDISEGALQVAASQDFNEEIARTGARYPQFIWADVLKGPKNCEEISGRQFDIIVSNPPYVMDSEKALMRTNVLDHEPHLALFVPDNDPLKFYRAIAHWAAALLKDGGVCIVEINEALGKETAELFIEAGFRNVGILEDLHEKDRFVRFTK